MLRCDSLHVSYGATTALDDVSLHVAEGEIVAVMGESGSGKSTLLRAVAGLVQPQPGTVVWRQRDVTTEPVHVRRFGFMFQDYALFPHMSAGANVAFGLRMQGHSPDRLAATVEEMLDLVGLAGYAERDVAELSGGERQRVALARTLAPAPELVLLDEPLGALDRARRDQLLSDMQRIFADVGVTALYVTHDHREAFAIADRIAVLDSGRMVATGTAPGLWNEPRHLAVATLLGFPVLHDIAVVGGYAEIAGSRVPVDIPDGVQNVAIKPGSVSISAGGAVPVTVRAHRFEDGVSQAVVEFSDTEAVATAPHGVSIGPATVEIDAGGLVQLAD